MERISNQEILELNFLKINRKVEEEEVRVEESQEEKVEEIEKNFQIVADQGTVLEIEDNEKIPSKSGIFF